MTNRVLNWGLLSTAHINRALIPPLKASKRNRLLAVASRSQATADEYARERNIPRALGSYEAMIGDPEIDVIYNSLPNHLHAEWTIKALRAGKHVLCEKPLALTLTEADAMISASRETGKVLAEAFMYRHHPQTFKVKEIVDSGMLGDLQTVRGAFTFTLTGKNDIRSRKETGGGSIWDVGCYPISFARTIMNAEPVEAFGWQVMGADGADVSFFGQLRFPNERFAQFDSGFKSPSRAQVEIVGTAGTLNIPEPFKPGPAEKIYLKRGDQTETINVKGRELYIGEVEDMADAILLGKQPRISLADSRGNTAVILALIESAQSGQPVNL
jgi:xylose dehydrogenase (NAD/NADP)